MPPYDLFYRDPAQYTFRYLSLGGGVQSSTLVEMMVEGELEPVDAVIFSDTEDEPAYVYEHVTYLRSRLAQIGIPLIEVTQGDLVARLYAPAQRYVSIPAYTWRKGKRAQLPRQCTYEYKIRPINFQVRRQMLERGAARVIKGGAVRVYRGNLAQCLLGISTDEFTRMHESKVKWIHSAWPLVHLRWSRHDCKLWLERKGLPIPGKSSCRICPYHANRYWRATRDERPPDWEHAVALDTFLRSGQSRFIVTAKGPLYLHDSRQPLNEVDLDPDTGQLELCESGFCFT